MSKTMILMVHINVTSNRTAAFGIERSIYRLDNINNFPAAASSKDTRVPLNTTVRVSPMLLDQFYLKCSQSVEFIGGAVSLLPHIDVVMDLSEFPLEPCLAM